MGVSEPMRNVIFAFSILAAVMFAFVSTSVIAVPPGKTIVYEDSKMGNVTFDGKIHADHGKKCTDCHPKLFPMKKGATKITFTQHTAGKETCFACHNGKVAFKAMGNCAKCHKK